MFDFRQLEAAYITVSVSQNTANSFWYCQVLNKLPMTSHSDVHQSLCYQPCDWLLLNTLPQDTHFSLVCSPFCRGTPICIVKYHQWGLLTGSNWHLPSPEQTKVHLTLILIWLKVLFNNRKILTCWEAGNSSENVLRHITKIYPSV